MAIRNLHIDRPKSLSRMVAEEIKEAIMQGVLQPGDKLVETSLTESLGVSRTPLREAFRELAAEGYITVIPHKGAYVSSLSEEDVLDLYAISSVLEGLAARLVAQNLKAESDREKLRSLYNELKEQNDKGNVDAYWAANRNFHQFIAEASGNPRLLDLIENMRRQILKTRVISMRYPERLEDSMAEHEEILGAILAGEGRKAESLVIEHLEKQREFVLDLIREAQDDPKDPS